MFTYIQITDEHSKVLNGYVMYKIKDDILNLSFIRGMRNIIRLQIPISEMKNLYLDKSIGDNISFYYQDKKYLLLDSGYGEADYLKNKLFKMSEV